MSRFSDFLHEMSDEAPRSDAFPAPFAEEVRFAVSGPPPTPSPALAAVLAGGFSHPTDKGDLLVTAASNVHGPASPQVAGLPNWRKRRDMHASGCAPGLLARLAQLGTAAKAAMACTTAVATMGLAGAAAGALPGPAQHLVASAVNAATPFQLPDTGSATAAVDHATSHLPAVTVPSVTVPGAPAVPPVSVSASASASGGSGGSAVNANGAGSATAKAPAAPVLPAVPGLSGGAVPALPPVSVPAAAANLVGHLPACVANLVPTGGAGPNPTTLATQIPACIPQVLAAAGLPADVAKCVSSVLGAIGGANGMPAGSVPNVSGLNVSSCVPLDATKCVTNMLSFLGTLPGLAGGGVPGVGSIPALGNVTGCVPMNVTTCISSITSALGSMPATGGAPKIDLSACMPTAAAGVGSLSGLTSAVPGLGSGLPGLSGALPFLGR